MTCSGSGSGAGYTPFYVSPRFNKYTGEKNIGVAKPLTAAGRRVLEEAARELRLRLLFSAHSVYRDLAAEKIAALLRALPSVEPAIGLTPGQKRRLCMHLQGLAEAEQALDALYLAAAIALSQREAAEGLGERRLLLAVARLLQGKPLDEAAEAAGIPAGQLAGELRGLAKFLADAAGVVCG